MSEQWSGLDFSLGPRVGFPLRTGTTQAAAVTAACVTLRRHAQVAGPGGDSRCGEAKITPCLCVDHLLTDAAKESQGRFFVLIRVSLAASGASRSGTAIPPALRSINMRDPRHAEAQPATDEVGRIEP